MADLGAISVKLIPWLQRRVIPIWVNEVSSLDRVSRDVTDSITVTVEVDNVAVQNATVFLYYKQTGRLIATLKTNTSGQATFVGLDVNDAQAYFAVAVHDTINYLVYGDL